MQVGLPRRAARKRARLSQKTRFGINPLDQPVHALIAGTQPPARALFLKRAQFFGQRVLLFLAVRLQQLYRREQFRYRIFLFRRRPFRQYRDNAGERQPVRRADRRIRSAAGWK